MHEIELRAEVDSVLLWDEICSQFLPLLVPTPFVNLCFTQACLLCHFQHRHLTPGWIFLVLFLEHFKLLYCLPLPFTDYAISLGLELRVRERERRGLAS